VVKFGCGGAVGEAETGDDCGVGEESHRTKESIWFSQNEIRNRKKDRGMKKRK
jgi:hypothetical protein